MLEGKVLIFSDTHFKHRFDVGRFELLKGLIEEADRVIVNGDLWDYWFVSWEDFLESEWSGLFGLLKSKQAVYLYGNHDPEEEMDERMNLFCDWSGKEFAFESGGTRFMVTHGNQLVNKNRGILKPYKAVIKWFVGKPEWRWLMRVLTDVESVGYRFIGYDKVVKNYLAQALNREMKQAKQEKYVGYDWLVCGDSHLAETDNEAGFVNTGCVLMGVENWVLVEDGEVSMIV